MSSSTLSLSKWSLNISISLLRKWNSENWTSCFCKRRKKHQEGRKRRKIKLFYHKTFVECFDTELCVCMCLLFWRNGNGKNRTYLPKNWVIYEVTDVILGTRDLFGFSIINHLHICVQSYNIFYHIKVDNDFQLQHQSK